MAKSYFNFTNKDTHQKAGDPDSSLFKNQRQDECPTRTLQFSGRRRILDETTIWKTALQIETAEAD
jgi:hypothetical protein